MRLILLVGFALFLCQGIAQEHDHDAQFSALNGLIGKHYIDRANALAYEAVVGDLARSDTVFARSLRYAQELGYTLGEAETHRWCAIVTFLQGSDHRSFYHNQEAIRLFRSLRLTAKEGDQYCSLGFQMKRRDLPQATAYMQKGMRMLESVQDSGRLTAVYDNYGVLKLLANDADSAAHYYLRALALKTSLGDSLGIPYSLNKLGEVYLQRHQLPAARKAFDQAFHIRTLRNDAFGIMENKACYGDYFLAAQRPDSAIHWYGLALAHSRANAYPFMTRYCFEQLSKCHEMAGNLPMALQMHRAFYAISDSLKNDLRIRQVAEMETRFGTLEKQQENALLKQLQAEQELALSRQKVWIVGLSGTAVAFLLLGLYLLQRNRQREAAKRDAAIIAERDRGMRAIILATEEERKRIAKDLHDGIVQTLTGIGLRLQRDQTSMPNVETATTGTMLNEAIAEVRNISHQMMPRALSELGLVPAMADMLHKSLSTANIPFSFHHHRMDQRLHEATEVGLYRIAQELTTNIIKHAQASSVTVQLMRSNTHILLTVEDNGKGIAPDANGGIGLTNIQGRASALSGTAVFENAQKGGTVAMVRIPL